MTATTPKRIGRIWPSLLGAGVLLFFDVVEDGSYLSSLCVCPIWIFASAIRNLVNKPGWRLALLRIAIPAVTFGISDANMTLQWKIGNENGDRIIAACEEFHAKPSSQFNA